MKNEDALNRMPPADRPRMESPEAARQASGLSPVTPFGERALRNTPCPMSRPLNVVSLCWEYPPFTTGGLGVACWGLNSALEARGRIRPRVLTPRHVHGDPPSHRLVCAYDGQYGDALDQVQRFSQACVEELEGQPVDVVHAHDWMAFPAAFALRSRRGCRIVAHFHSTEADRSGACGSQPIVGIESCAYGQADAVVAVSRYTADLLRGQFGGRQDGGAKVVHNGHGGAIHRGAALFQRERRAVFVGRMTHQKGVATLLAAVGDVLLRDSDAKVTIVGGGPLEDQARAFVEESDWSHRVSVTGSLGRASIEAILDNSRVLVMPSNSEPFGLVALEAMARGVPVIASARSGVTEANPHLRSVRANKKAQLATAILELLTADDQAERQRHAAAEAMAICTWDRAASMIEGILESAALRAPPRSTNAPDPE